MNESDFPPLYEAADAAAKNAQSRFLWALGVNLFMLVCAAALTVYEQPHVYHAIAQSIVLFVSLFLTIYLAAKQPQRIWYGTRALAESIKTVTWRYVMRAEPFNIGEADSRTTFVDSVRKIFESNKQVSAEAVAYSSNSMITQAMRDLRAGTLQARKAAYREKRINDQLSWYRKKAKWNRDHARNWFVFLIAVNAGAILLAISRIAYPQVKHWPTDILVAAAAGILAWLQTKRFHELSATYTLTAHEIVLMVETLPEQGTEKEFSNFVGDAENAFSREHTQWQARRDVE